MSLALRIRTWLKLLAIGAGAATAGAAAALVIAWVLSPFPSERLNRWPASRLVTDRTGKAVLSVVGIDEQWRFPVPLDKISPWLPAATIAVEDERFRGHIGIDPLAVVRAMGQNVAALRTVSGASTLTMQLCRMMDDRPRTASAKLIESFRAAQLERLRSKDQILECYLNIAPYGGNLRGVEAAARTYFRKPAADLSLGEAALLAGLPQSPSRYRPDRFPERARARRDQVLGRMQSLGMITMEQMGVAAAEPVPARDGHDLSIAPHAGWLALQRRPAGGRTTIDPLMQREIAQLAADHALKLPPRTQVAVVVIDISASEIVALVGSVEAANPIDGSVNGAVARRSPGSTLKPFVYAAAFEAGILNAESTVYDVPIERAGWAPANFNRQFAGQVTASDALRGSLNVPAILVAEGAGLPRCLGLIEAVGIHLPRDVQQRAGLGIVVGAAEVTLLDLVNGYATLGRGGLRSTPRLFLDEPVECVRVLEANNCGLLDDILSSRRRHPHGMEQRQERDLPWFMWKTGTSSGRRDAWAVGHNRRYAMGVWVGRFSGGGDPQYVGAESAEPLLAAMFDLPLIRRTDAPPTPQPIPVTQPLPPPPEVGGDLRILSPSAGARFIAVEGSATVHVHANLGRSLTWFLNGICIGEAAARRLVLGAGSYEIRCVTSEGQSASRSFTVLTSPQRDRLLRDDSSLPRSH